MSRKLSLLMAFLIVFTSIYPFSVPVVFAETVDQTTVTGINIVDNGDMEGGINSQYNLPNWWYASGCTGSPATDEKYSGNYSIKVEGRTGAWAGPGQELTGNTKGGPVAGKKYHATAWVKYNGDDTVPATVQFALGFQWNGDQIKDIKYQDVPKGQWTKIEGDITVASDMDISKGAHIQIKTTQSTVDFYADDISMVELNSATPTPVSTVTATTSVVPTTASTPTPITVLGKDIVDNGDMEGGINSQYNLPNWWYASGCTGSPATDEKYSGNYSIKVEGRTGAWAGPGQELTGNTKGGPVAGKKYHATAWVKYNGDDTVPATVQFALGFQWNGDQIKDIKYQDVPKGQWTKIEGDITVASDMDISKGAHIQIKTTQSTVDFYADDISMVELNSATPTPVSTVTATPQNLNTPVATVTATPTAPGTPTPTSVPVSPNKLIALTFDDGPDITKTPLVLAKLKKYDVPATFMMVGEEITNEAASAVKADITSLGCEIGNHSWSYADMANMSAEQIQKSISDTNAAIKTHFGVTPKFFRPPSLATSSVMFDAVDLIFVKGITANDWVSTTTAQQRADAIIKSPDLKDGAIILLHDVQPGDHPTPEALDIIIPTLKAQGYKFVTLSELFASKGVTIPDPDNDTFYYNATDSKTTSANKYNFENSTQGWAAKGTGVQVAADTGAAYKGTYSLKVTGRNGENDGASLDAKSILQKGAVYQISGYVKLVNKPVTK